WLLVARSFSRNRCPVRASALAYTTLLGLIPMLFVAVSLSSSLLKKQGTEGINQFIDRFVSAVVGTGAATKQPAKSDDDTAGAELFIADHPLLGGDIAGDVVAGGGGDDGGRDAV